MPHVILKKKAPSLNSRISFNMAITSIRYYHLVRLVSLWMLFSFLGLYFVRVYKEAFIYKNNDEKVNNVNEFKTIKPRMTFNRSILCPNYTIIQDPKDAIIKEISKNRTSKDCRINLKAGKNIYT